MADEPTETWANVGNAPPLVQQLMLLQKKEGFALALMASKGNEVKGATIDNSRTAQWLLGLQADCADMLLIENEQLFKDISEALAKDKTVADHYEAFCKLMAFLRKKGLKWDTKQAYDSSRVEEENRAYKV